MKTLSYKVKDFFFDRIQVMEAVGKAKLKMLGRAGGSLRLEARRTQLRRRKRTSAAGSPPSVHSRDNVATLRNILYAFNGIGRVICGPVGLNGHSVVNGRRVAGAIPGLMEHGGTKRIRLVLVGREWVPEGAVIGKGKRKRMIFAKPGQPTKMIDAKYPARPFMGPALKAVAKRLPLLFFRTLQ